MRQSTANYYPFFLSALLMWVVLYFIYPYYQYSIDPDGTSYLTISARYAEGDFQRAINGLWSPWACWLTALLIKVGLQPIPASVIVNAAGATGFLFISNSLFIRFGLSAFLTRMFNLSLVVFLCFAVFWQSFDDLWQCFFLLCILRIMLIGGFVYKPGTWLGIGAIGGLAYYAKAYSLPFFILNTAVCTWFLSGKNVRQWIKVMTVSVFVILAFAFPWMYALHSKYGIWTTSTAGSLNMSWYLVGHPEWKEGIDILLPPVYHNSPYYWEDPYVSNGHISHFWDSWRLFGLQVLRFGLNCITLALCILQFSLLFPFIVLLILIRVVNLKKFAALYLEEKVVYLSVLLLPSGYIMVHLESRYLWYALPLCMVVGGLFIQQRDFKTAVQKKYAIFLFSLSLMVYPLLKLKDMYLLGKDEYVFAKRLNSIGFKGQDFVSNVHPRLLSKIAYFSGNRFYVITKQKPPSSAGEMERERPANTVALVKDIKRYGVRYYLHAPGNSGILKNPSFDEIFYENLKDANGIISFKTVLRDSVSGMSLYEIP